MDWLVRHRFLTLLVALALLLVSYPALSEFRMGHLVHNVLASAVFLAGIFAIMPERRYWLVALLIGVPTLLGFWTGYVFPGLPQLQLTVFSHAVAVLFLGLLAYRVLARIFGATAITTDDLCGAFCGYLLIGVAFGHLYTLTETVAPHSFRGTTSLDEELRDPSQRHVVMTYFSMITLTTLGYGDIAPARGTARALVVVEALLGQFYVAVLIAELVSRRGPRQPDAPQTPDPKS
jgi:hypothetical protein